MVYLFKDQSSQLMEMAYPSKAQLPLMEMVYLFKGQLPLMEMAYLFKAQLFQLMEMAFWSLNPMTTRLRA